LLPPSNCIKGGKGVRGAGGRELPISEAMSLAEIREFVRRESLDLEVKTSGAGRTKQAILKDIAAVWLRRQASEGRGGG
jgi:hypothetical protein